MIPAIKINSRYIRFRSDVIDQLIAKGGLHADDEAIPLGGFGDVTT